MSNVHMNIFHHYTQSGSLPIENNISRGWAILLQEYPALLFMFLEKIRKENTTNVEIPYPDGEYLVEFQRNTTDFGDADRIVGIALTAEELTDDYAVGNVSVASNYNPITDISLEYDGTIIIIEVKRSGEDCRKQLEEQIDKCEQTMIANNHGNPVNLEKTYVALTWTNIIEILERYIAIKGSKPERLIYDYYTNLVYHYPSWTPVEPLARLSIEDSVRIQKRLDMIKQEYAKGNSELIFNRQAIAMDYSYATECNIYIDKDLYTHNKKREACLVMGIWPSDTCGQFWALKKVTKSYEFAKKRYRKINLDQFGEMNLRVLPYIKLCHFNQGIMNFYLDVTKEDNHLDALLELGNAINGKWKREEANNDGWKKFLKLIKDSGIYSNDEFTSFEADFTKKFWNTNRSYLTASVGFEVYMYMTYEEAQRWDNGKSDAVGFPEMIREYIEKIDLLIQE